MPYNLLTKSRVDEVACPLVVLTPGMSLLVSAVMLPRLLSCTVLMLWWLAVHSLSRPQGVPS